ncbi:response regulator [Parasphingorhabdus sp.]|uniref:response regulator transcription factor n=1 Tax=Parasphingorhabdus sp. TaxID=2709688 RepID=UPI0032ECC72C
MNFSVALIDDDEAVRESLRELLLAAGYQISPFSSCAEFLNHLGGQFPDALLLDHEMPGMTGVELAEWLSLVKLQIPILMITANMAEQMRVRATRAGVRTILDKPFSDHQLLTALEEVKAAPSSEEN